MKYTNIIDIAFTGAERNSVCFNSLKTLLRSLVSHTDLALEDVPISDKDFEIPGPPDPKRALAFTPAILLEKVNRLEEIMSDMNGMLSNEYLMAALQHNLYKAPFNDMWDYSKVRCNISCNKYAIEKLYTVIEEITEETDEQSNFVQTVKEALLPSDEQNESQDPPQQPMSIKAGMNRLTVVVEEFKYFKEDMKKLLEGLGSTTVPDEPFFLNCPSYHHLDALFYRKYRFNEHIDDRIRMMQEDPSENLRHNMTAISEMVNDDISKMERIKAMELKLAYFNEVQCSKEEFQKLITKMQEIQGVAGAVDRLMCRIQGSEDQVCCLRQVTNRIYGCISENTGEDDSLQMCMGITEKKPKVIKTASDNLKDMKATFEKLQCDLDSTADALVLYDVLKIDVQNLFAIVNELDENKLEKGILATELAQKADKCLVEEKLSTLCFEVTCDGFNAVINDVLAKILQADIEWQKVINHLVFMIESKVDRDDVDGLKEQIENKLKCIAKRIIALQHHMGPKQTSKPVQVQQCLSCDRAVAISPNDPIPSIPSAPGLPGRRIIRVINTAPSLEVRNLSTLCGVKQPMVDPYGLPRAQGGTKRIEKKTEKIEIGKDKEKDKKNRIDESTCKALLDPDNQLLSAYSPATGPIMRPHPPPAPTRSDMKDFVKCVRDILDQAIVKAKAAVAAGGKNKDSGCSGFVFNSNKSNNINNNSLPPVPNLPSLELLKESSRKFQAQSQSMTPMKRLLSRRAVKADLPKLSAELLEGLKNFQPGNTQPGTKGQQNLEALEQKMRLAKRAKILIPQI